MIIKGSRDRLTLNCFKRGWNNFVTCCGKCDNCCTACCTFKPPPLRFRKSWMSATAIHKAHNVSPDRSSKSEDSIYHSLSSEALRDDALMEEEEQGGGGGIGGGGRVKGQTLDGKAGEGLRSPRKGQKKPALYRGRYHRCERGSLARPDSASVTIQDPALQPVAVTNTTGTMQRRRKASACSMWSTQSLPQKPSYMDGRRASLGSVDTKSRYEKEGERERERYI